jgi:hypothetical protein
MMNLSELLNNFVDNRISKVYTAMVGEVLSYEPDKRLAQVQPLVRLLDDRVSMPIGLTDLSKFPHYELPVIHDVMVNNLYIDDDTYINIPVGSGTKGLLIFSTFNLDDYLLGEGDFYNAKSTSTHEISNAVFFPGIVPGGSVSTSNEPDKLKLKNGLSEVALSTNGKVRIKGSTTELVKAVKDLVESLQSATVLTAVGPQLLDAATQAKLVELNTAVSLMEE